MNGIDTQRFQVLDGPVFCQGEELARVFAAHAFHEELPRVEVHVAGDGEVAVVHLVDDEVGRRLHHGPAVGSPPFGVGLLHVDDGGALAVHSHGLGKDARRLPPGVGVVAASDGEGIESAIGNAFFVLHRGSPYAIHIFHLEGLEWLPSLSLGVEAHFHLFGLSGGKEPESGLLWGDHTLLEIEILRM